VQGRNLQIALGYSHDIVYAIPEGITITIEKQTHMVVSGADKVWIGLEYFCNDTDDLWKLSDEQMSRFAITEIAKIGILKADDVEDFHVVRVPKTYPAYFGSYDRFDVIRNYYQEQSE